MTEEWAEAFQSQRGGEKMSVPKARGNKDEGRGFTCMHKLKGKPETGGLAREIHFQVSGLSRRVSGSGSRVQVQVPGLTPEPGYPHPAPAAPASQHASLPAEPHRASRGSTQTTPPHFRLIRRGENDAARYFHIPS